MRITARILAVVATVALLAGCPAPPPADGPVQPGAFCKPAGATGKNAEGAEMICTTAPDDPRNRWRTP